MGECNCENCGLKQEIRELEYALKNASTVSKNLKYYVNETYKLRADKTRLENRVKELETKNDSHEIGRLEAINGNLQNDLDSINRGWNRDLEELQRLRNRVKELKGDREILHNKRAKDNEKLKAEVTRLEHELRERPSDNWYEREKLRKRNAELRVHVEELKAEVSQLEEIREELHRNLNGYLGTIRELRESIEGYKAKVTKLEHELRLKDTSWWEKRAKWLEKDNLKLRKEIKADYNLYRDFMTEVEDRIAWVKEHT